MSIINKIKNTPSVVSAMRQFEAMPKRDQQALVVLAVALFLAILYFLVWSPAHEFANKQQNNLQSSKELLSWVQANEGVAKSLVANSGAGSSTILDSQSLVSTVSANAQKHNIKLKRFEPSGDRKVRVWLEKVPFNTVIVWLRDLNETYSIGVSQVSIDKDEKGGLVNVRLTLKG
ncbi:type II secretion system protein M [Alkalimarinus sediminis]|uniref:Type II secretion system protein M n=2 Tax=Alkalimarinus sediminis TaxID=1632866 RepID=A0A9E8HKB8_9ALTE|nr:type II secretion system protein M [Alkalimarinus sediminis]UZW76230.1 type II secretion system protein M [Alkalimarinus sediminis]